MRRLEQVAGTGAPRVWQGCVVGSSLAHIVLLGACLLIQPVSERARPTLRVRLVEEASVGETIPTVAELPRVAKAVSPSPPQPRRTLRKALPRAAQVPAAPPPAVEALPELPAVPEADGHSPLVTSHPHLTPTMERSTPPPAVPLVTPLPGAPPGASEGNKTADAPGLLEIGEERKIPQPGGGSGPTGPSGSPEAAPRGPFLLSGQGSGVGTGYGPGMGPGSSPGEGRGAGQGGGISGSHGTSGGAEAPRLGGAGAGSNGRDGAEVLRIITGRIKRVWSYPDIARREGLEGQVELRFRIAPDGSAEAVQILKSSGHAVLDDDLVQTVQRAAPYPPYGGWIRFPFTYRLDR